MTTEQIDPAYTAGLKADGLARFIDSSGSVWLIPLKDMNGGADWARSIFTPEMEGPFPAYPDSRDPDRFDRVLDEYLASREASE